MNLLPATCSSIYIFIGFFAVRLVCLEWGGRWIFYNLYIKWFFIIQTPREWFSFNLSCFILQHGANECLLNVIEACTIKEWPDVVLCKELQLYTNVMLWRNNMSVVTFPVWNFLSRETCEFQNLGVLGVCLGRQCTFIFIECCDALYIKLFFLGNVRVVHFQAHAEIVVQTYYLVGLVLC